MWEKVGFVNSTTARIIADAFVRESIKMADSVELSKAASMRDAFAIRSDILFDQANVWNGVRIELSRLEALENEKT